MTSRFRDAMRQMRSRNPQTQEDGFHTLLPIAGEHLAELIEEFNAEPDNHGLRCWLLELIGEARSGEAFELLAAQLDNPDHSLSSWAVRGLELLDTKQARQLLWHWGQNSPNPHPQHQRWGHNSLQHGAKTDP